MKHKHCEVIKAWADGNQIQFLDKVTRKWVNVDNPSWNIHNEYRIMPNWYDNIPRKGVICWVNDDFEHIKKSISIIKEYNNILEKFISYGGMTWKYATPLTIDEFNEFNEFNGEIV